MLEEVKIFPTVYFICILFFYFVTNFTKLHKTGLKWVIFFLFIGWSLFLGLRNIYDIDFDPAFYHYQAKNLSFQEIWEASFPKVDMLLQVIMKFYFWILPDDVIVLILSEATIVGLIFIGTALLTRFNLNSLLIILSSLVFTNTGILLTGNFLRQGLAIALFLNIVYILNPIEGSNKKRLRSDSLLLYIPSALLLFFAHMSSIFLLILQYLTSFLRKGKLTKLSSQITFGLVLLGSLLLFPLAFSTSSEVYSGYAVNATGEENTIKLLIKLIIDAIALVALMYTKSLINKSPNFYFNLIIKICIFLFSTCIFYSPIPGMSLRLEYYLSFLLIVALSCLISNESTSKWANKVITFFSVIAMYIYSYAVYDNPSITVLFPF